MKKLTFPRVVPCKHCHKIVYACVCCTDIDKRITRWAVVIDGWTFDHDCPVNGEHEVSSAEA